ncbi:molybdopterin-dependent oxidoreductase [Pseudonocardia endophytica]|uniref:Molybdopterin-dependent oxidoreductase-like protein n=1 Tax=Pseudonocardia endophytica TaxID=401976 RepID=A0A4R1HXT2_PSEEN|nr:molybdopterin-dependent oxidoreductase [Pseudonocardia endophytica]TCK24879.1 hypothetical protein EV378_0672 [Pseudonocardia endophytica]
MPRLRWFLLLPVLLCALLAGCGSAPVVTAVAPVAQTASPQALAPGDVAVTGDVATPFTLTPAKLASYPQKTVPATFRSGTALEAHTFRGALLSDILPTSALAPAPGKNPFLSFAVLGRATDGYQALVAYGEFAPDFANTQVLVATVQDGKPLARPRLVVPGDGRGGRYVTDLVELTVVRVAP